LILAETYLFRRIKELRRVPDPRYCSCIAPRNALSLAIRKPDNLIFNAIAIHWAFLFLLLIIMTGSTAIVEKPQRGRQLK